MEKKKKGLNPKYAYYLLGLVLFILLTSARVSPGDTVQEVVDSEGRTTAVVEKLVNVTKYRDEKVPFGQPRCIQFVYNFSKVYVSSEALIDGKRVFTCTFFVKNEEDVPGNFSFYSQLVTNKGITEGEDKERTIAAFGVEKFEWNFTVDLGESVSCMLQSYEYPNKMRCFYLEPITYELKKVPYLVEELKNVTEYVPAKEKVTKMIYRNRFFGYKQFFYLGY